MGALLLLMRIFSTRPLQIPAEGSNDDYIDACLFALVENVLLSNNSITGISLQGFLCLEL